ncbi:hypothetical protein AB0M44_38485 [Streptosporangium subroseum]|uniref:hypothetical protein n=1 Tax=Streptosporangium subroseum TaxID=106412 RepID=UPI0034236750
MLGTGPALAGLEFLPFALGVIAGSVLAIKLGYRLAPRTLLVSGGLLTAAGFAWFGLTLGAALLATAVLIALTVLPRTSPPSRAEQADDRDALLARD